MVTMRDNKDHIKVLLYCYFRVGVLLGYWADSRLKGYCSGMYDIPAGCRFVGLEQLPKP